MEFLCKLLNSDLEEVLTALSNTAMVGVNAVDALEPVESASYTIRHKYPDRLVTYDAEELGEQRFLRFSDLTPSMLDAMKPVRRNMGAPRGQGDKHRVEPKPRDKAKEFISKCIQPLSERNPKLTERHLMQLEINSKALHRAAIKEGGTCAPDWESLKPIRKFCYYWQALTGHQLRATPFENFKDIFVKRYKQLNPRVSSSFLGSLVRRSWRCLRTRQRTPFNLHALLHHVGSGYVDPHDHCAVRVLLNRWR